MTAAVAVTCADCGLTDIAPAAALSGVQYHQQAAKPLCGPCGERVARVAPPATPPATPRIDAVEPNGREGGKVASPLGGTPPATQSRLVRCNVPEMLVGELEPVPWLIEGVVARGTLTLLAGREKEGKSLLAGALSVRMSSGGGDIAGRNCIAGRILIIDAENGQREIKRRVRAFGLTSQAASNLEIYEAHGYDLADTGALEELIKWWEPDAVVLDSWRSMWTGDENDSRAVAAVLDPLRNLIRKHDVGCILIHHMRKAGGYRGSSAVGASVENVLELARMEEDGDRRRRRLRNPSCRYEQEAEDRWLRIEADRARGLLTIEECEPFTPERGGKRSSMKEQLLDALNGPTEWADWVKKIGVEDPKDRTARRARDELAAEGHVEQRDDGWVRATGIIESSSSSSATGWVA